MAIDPRIRARRVAVHRQEGRRRLRFLLTALGLVAVAVAAWGLTRTPLLDLDHVRYEGVSGADAGEVEAVAGLATGTAMVDLDLGRVEREIEALPWVASATASRDWPGTVRVVVVARTPVAVVGTADGPSFLADADGVLLRQAPPVVAVPRVAVEPTVALGEVDTHALPGISVAVKLPADLTAWVEAITIDVGTSDTGPSLGLDLMGSARVHLGFADLVDDKLAAVRALLQSADLACLDLIDVSVADLPTMTRDADCESGITDAAGGDA